MNAELETTSQQIAPRAGAIVLLKFSTTIGRAILMTVTRTDGNSLPIGSGVFDENGKEIGMLAQGQRFFNRSLGSKGRLLVKWGEEHDQHCLAAYTLPKETTTASTLPYEQLSVSCTPNQD
jgi:outer membrane usher protein